MLPSLISSDQTAYLNSSLISEGGRLIPDISEVSDLLKLKGLLLTVDIEKAIDSVKHNFLFKALENYGFNQDFVNWISILFQNQESCVINGGKTTGYFSFEKRCTTMRLYCGLPFRKSFHFFKKNENVQGLTIFNNQFLCIVYTDDTPFFFQ